MLKLNKNSQSFDKMKKKRKYKTNQQRDGKNLGRNFFAKVLFECMKNKGKIMKVPFFIFRSLQNYVFHL